MSLTRSLSRWQLRCEISRILRALGSSPAAAAATLRVRAAVADAESADEADELGQRTVMDHEEETEGADVEPGSQLDDDAEASPLAELARRLLARRASLRIFTGAQRVRHVRVDHQPHGRRRRHAHVARLQRAARALASL